MMQDACPRLFRLLVPLILMIIPALAQAPGTLSGTWKLNSEKTVLPDKAKAPAEQLAIKATADIVEFQHKVENKGVFEHYVVDRVRHSGKVDLPDGNVVGTGYYKASWKDSVLVLEHDLVFDDYYNHTMTMHVKSTWTLSGNGNVLTEVWKSEGPNDFTKIVRVYDRQ